MAYRSQFLGPNDALAESVSLSLPRADNPEIPEPCERFVNFAILRSLFRLPSLSIETRQLTEKLAIPQQTIAKCVNRRCGLP